MFFSLLIFNFSKDIESPTGVETDDVTSEDIYREYVKMQRDIVSGRLICSKEEAATLAAVQLRLEAWPEENLELAEGNNNRNSRKNII